MQTQSPEKNSREGFAVITVLFSLAIITILLTSATRLNMNQARVVSDQVALSNRPLETETLLYLAVAERSSLKGDSVVSFIWEDSEYVAEFQDVGGLIDLNTASPGLLHLLLIGLGEDDPSEYVLKYQEWRRLGHNLQRVRDFARVTGLPSSTAIEIEEYGTVFSGRRGIAPRVSPLALLEVLTGERGSVEYLSSRIPRPHRSNASSVNFRVRIVDDLGRTVVSATVYLSAQQGNLRILEL